MKGKSKKGLIIWLVLLAIVIAAAVFTVVVLLTRVNGLKATEVRNDSVVLEWNASGRSSGYKIYLKDKDAEEYSEVGTVNNGAEFSYKVDALEQAEEYSFMVKAYSVVANKQLVEPRGPEISVCTLPAAPEGCSALYVNDGAVEFRYTENEKAVSYEIEYSKNPEFRFPKKEVLKKGETTAVIEKLDKSSEYYFRARCIAKVGDKKVAGEWSATTEIISYDDYILAADVDPNKPMIALTFDDGPGYNNASDRIVDVLEKYHARATFFMVGTNVADHPKNLKRKVDLGCEIGNHTYNHGHYGSKVTANDIKMCSDIIYETCGKRPTCFRSPGGETTDLIQKECKEEKMAIYYWSVDTNDWKYRDAKKVYNHVMNNAKDGDIVLMHEIYGTTADAVEKMIPELIAKGYQLVTVSELVKAKTGKPPVKGQEYFTADRIKKPA